MNHLEKKIIENYPVIGIKGCAEKFNIPYNKVAYIGNKFGLKVNKESRKKIQSINTKKSWRSRNIIHPVDEKIFINNVTKESAYMLGFIWGDGYIVKNKKMSQIRIECLKEDVEAMKKVFDKTGNWVFNFRLRKNRTKEVGVVSTTNRELVDFLFEMEYNKKSTSSPNKIIDFLAEKYIYFILGYLDADGCFYFNSKQSLRQLTFTSTYEQDWTFIEKIYTELNVKYSIINVVNKTNKYSQIRVTNKKDIKKIGDLLYKDLIVFKRKYNNFIKIIE